MAVLRLKVVVQPREQISPRPGFFSSLIGGSNHNEQSQDETNTPRKWPSFLLLIRNPDETSLGDLVNLIQAKWRSLRPSEELLQVKKLLNDADPEIDYEVHDTVADVWIDHGKFEREGYDQYGTVRVVQKPPTTPLASSPQRFPSVVQDWDGAAQDARRRSLLAKSAIGKVSPILEGDEMEDEPDNIPLESVEEDHVTIRQTPSVTHHASEELGEVSPRVTECPAAFFEQESQPQKRKYSPQQTEPSKRLRIEPEIQDPSPNARLSLNMTATPIQNLANHNIIPTDLASSPASMPPPPLPHAAFTALQKTPVPQHTPSSFRSDHATPPSSQPTSSQGERFHLYVKRDQQEIHNLEALLRDPTTNPEVCPLLQEMREIHAKIQNLEQGVRTNQTPRSIKNLRKTLSRRRNRVETHRSKGTLHRPHANGHVTGNKAGNVTVGVATEPVEDSQVQPPLPTAGTTIPRDVASPELW
ncbi:uncharacterized protein N7482_010702 [Penicillium canariense]|uniref:Uncharacterized protein n=1 Tax=Penicillium canariense TaxID=189055 RepID=A0A9W9HMP2_9EURO|nr:uncharacterized protein N7482_010702 [Penicillium canariense]KAJ5151450.1 hypothetical protein N7482_010702 [Penicillium canariense]